MNFELVAAGIVVTPVIEEIDAQPELWDQITIRQSYPGSAHHDTEAIFLRGPVVTEVTPLAAVFDVLESADYPALETLPLAADLVRQALSWVGAVDVGRAMIVNLHPGGVIDPHVDEGKYAETFERFHIVLQSEEGNSFTVGGETVHMEQGQMWWFDHRKEHTVRNDSNTRRLHIIVDALRSPI